MSGTAALATDDGHVELLKYILSGIPTPELSAPV